VALRAVLVPQRPFVDENSVVARFIDFRGREIMSECARLIAIVGVNEDARVQCQQPGCGHSIYRRIHVVQESGKLMVLGSTCYEKRFGSASALGNATHGGGGGRELTVEERELLVQNTAELIARFEREREEIEKKRKEADQKTRDKLQALKSAFETRAAAARHTPALSNGWMKSDTPWLWSKPLSSIACFTLNDGSTWVRTEHVEKFHVMMPWPSFDGWDEALPAIVGTPDAQLGGYRIENLVAAVAYMRAHGNSGVVGGWRDVMGKV